MPAANRRPLAILIASVALLAAMLAGCSMQVQSDRPSWSLNGPTRPPAPPANKTYGDWNGPGAPKPLMYGRGS